MMKAYPGLTPGYILNQMSYKNLIMYSRVIPSYNPKDKSKSNEGISNEEFFRTQLKEQ